MQQLCVVRNSATLGFLFVFVRKETPLELLKKTSIICHHHASVSLITLQIYQKTIFIWLHYYISIKSPEMSQDQKRGGREGGIQGKESHSWPRLLHFKTSCSILLDFKKKKKLFSCHRQAFISRRLVVKLFLVLTASFAVFIKKWL